MTTEDRAMWIVHRDYCLKQAKARAREGRHERARQWRLEAQRIERMLSEETADV